MELFIDASCYFTMQNCINPIHDNLFYRSKVTGSLETPLMISGTIKASKMKF